MPAQAVTVFDRLCKQVDELRSAANQELAQGHATTAASMCRACIVLSIAALDTYMHESGVELLDARAKKGTTDATAVAGYLGSVTVTDLAGPTAQGLIRLQLSYKTLVAPPAIDALLKAADCNETTVWMATAAAAGSQPNRLRTLTQVQYDRRNQIAHEGDWDPVAFDLRHVSDDHVGDCLGHVRTLVSNMDPQL